MNFDYNSIKTEKFKVGDVVIISETITFDNSGIPESGLEKYRGKTTTILQIRSNSTFQVYKLSIDGGNWGWWDALLEPASTAQQVEEEHDWREDYFKFKNS